MTGQYALVRLDATDRELTDAGVDASLPKQVPGLGYIDSGQIAKWVGITEVEGLISLNEASNMRSAEWEKRDSGGSQRFVHTERLGIIALQAGPSV